MTKITWKPGTMLAPVPPSLISCGSVDKPNVMTAAWTGIISSDPVMTYVSIRPGRYSHDIIKNSGEFVINLTNLPLVKAADFCGVKSGRNTDKFKEMNLTAAPCSEVTAPQIAEAPVSIECKVKSVTNYGTHDMFLAEVVAVNVDDKYLDEDGKLWLEKAGLVAYVHGFYYTLGRNLGKFGFSVEKNPQKVPEKIFEPKEDKKEKMTTHRSDGKFRNKEKRFLRDEYFGSITAERSGKRHHDDAFENRRPKRFSDERRRKVPNAGNKKSFEGKSFSFAEAPKKKFDGKSKFEKSRQTDYKKTSPAKKIHFGAEKPFK